MELTYLFVEVNSFYKVENETFQNENTRSLFQAVSTIKYSEH
jgi:hypothetical protein